jgi:quinol monooxygenase YgiN
MNEILNVVAIMNAKPGKVSELEALLQEALPGFQGEPGCRAYAVLQDKQDPCRFFSYEAWDDEAALQAHMSAPTLTKAMPILDRILAEPMEQIRLSQLSGSTV